jgi:chromate transporter
MKDAFDPNAIEEEGIYNECIPPRTLKELFWGFSMLSLQGFGGVMAVIQQELIERRRWMDREAFLEDWAVSQVLPGPSIANLGVIIGDRCLGVPGVLACLLGTFLFPFAIVILIALVLASLEHLQVVHGALRGMGLVVVALILTNAIKLIFVLRTHIGGVIFCIMAFISTFVAITVWRFPLIWVLLVIGGISCFWSYYRIIKVTRIAVGEK